MQGPLKLPSWDAYTLSLEEALIDCRGRLELLRRSEARREGAGPVDPAR